MLEKRGKHIPALHSNNKPPAGYSYIWLWFTEIADPDKNLSFQEIESWSKLKRIQLLPEEVTLLKRLSSAHRQAVLENMKTNE